MALPHVPFRPPLALFLRGKTVLITGATGFLGKVVVERLLRLAPEIGRIYVLIRDRRDPSGPPAGVLARFDAEIVGSAVFAALGSTHGDAWPAFLREKVVPVAGDVSLPGLGLSEADHAALSEQVDIVINSAASVTFDAPIDEALRHNTLSVSRMAAFVRGCRSAALVHVSTAYVAGRQTGTVMEGPLSDSSPSGLEMLEEAVAAVRAEAAAQHWDERTTRARLVAEGMRRAKALGWHDSYTYTKALGEMVLTCERGDVPVAIIRPSIIESSLREPEPGWLENLNVGDPLFVEFGRGRMPDFPLNVHGVFDIVPVDFVANVILAALPRLGGRAISYYAVGSGALNPVTGGVLYELASEYFARYPMYNRRGEPIPPPRLTFPTVERFRELYAEEAKRSATIRRLMYLVDLYETYMNGGCIFDTTNTQRLLDDLPSEDRAVLDFDVRTIDWRHYIQDVHLPGLRRHVLKDDGQARGEVEQIG